eukprot:TRINITY_DN8796_c0_g1_i10.p2 TRINITY_DN8796_c0_g1~~TRINITY_DN8796_c0_g1_i10.p2  ORF type:complete len:181 (-),score=25.88 TRINITY_DN8796_c0_g1_i10:148-690(-)
MQLSWRTDEYHFDTGQFQEYGPRQLQLQLPLKTCSSYRHPPAAAKRVLVRFSQPVEASLSAGAWPWASTGKAALSQASRESPLRKSTNFVRAPLDYDLFRMVSSQRDVLTWPCANQRQECRSTACSPSTSMQFPCMKEGLVAHQCNTQAETVSNLDQLLDIPSPLLLVPDLCIVENLQLI